MTRWLLILALAGGVFAADAPNTFTPVSPAPPIHAALQSSLKLTQDWLNDKDYISAAQSAQELGVLAQLYGYQSAAPEWRERVTALREASAKLAASARRKDAEGCARASRECEQLLAELAKRPPTGDKVVVPNFRPFGSLKTWMVLMDSAYSDAKIASSAKEIEQLAYAIAEEANVVTHLRGDARWRQFSLETRDAALVVADRARANDVDAARRELKTVYNRCEACHQGFKR